jgi:hypothetical protein
VYMVAADGRPGTMVGAFQASMHVAYFQLPPLTEGTHMIWLTNLEGRVLAVGAVVITAPVASGG